MVGLVGAVIGRPVLLRRFGIQRRRVLCVRRRGSEQGSHGKRGAAAEISLVKSHLYPPCADFLFGRIVVATLAGSCVSTSWGQGFRIYRNCHHDGPAAGPVAGARSRRRFGPCLPYAAPSDAGAVRHDMFLDARATKHTGLLFFCGAPIGRRNLELSHGSARRSRCTSASSTASLDRPAIRGLIPRPPGRLLWMASLLKHKRFPGRAGGTANCS